MSDRWRGRSEKASRLFVLRVFIVLALVATCAAFVCAAFRAIRMARASRTWPAVPAEITSSAARIVGYYGEYRLRANWDVDIDYDYWVDGLRYAGRRHRFSIWRFGGMSHEQALETVGRYPRGAHVTVRYDPARPEVSVLEPRADGVAVATCIMFGAMALLAAIWLPLSEIGVLPE